MTSRYGMANQPLTAMPESSGPMPGQDDPANAEAVPITVAGQQYLVPAAVAAAMSGAPGMRPVPEHYALPHRPDLEADGYFPDESHPIYEPVCAWCRKNGIDQAEFEDLARIYQDHEHAQVGQFGLFRDKEMTRLVERFAPGMDPADPAAQMTASQMASDDQRWLIGLLGPALRDRPDLQDIITDLYFLSDGADFIRALREAIGERTPSAQRAAAASGEPKSLAALLYDHPTSQ